MALLKRPDGARRQRKRLGRGPGSGHGTTAGKGTKGQNSRSGGGVRPGFEGGQMPLYRRVARRGFSNYRHKIEYTTVSVGTLDQRYDAGATVSLETLREHRLIGGNERYVKLLGDGDVSKELIVVGLKLSASARQKIEAAGGSVQERGAAADGTADRSGERSADGPADGSADAAPATDSEDDE